MQLQQLANAEVKNSVTRTGPAAGCRRKQVKRAISQAACESVLPVQYSQQAAIHMPQGKTVCGPASSPCNGSALCISTPSLVDAAGTLCKAGAGTSDMTDSRHNSMHLDLQQCAGSAGAGHPLTKLSAPAASLAVTPAAATTAAAAAATDALGTSALLPGSSLLQQLHHLTCSLSEAVHSQDRPRQQLVLQLLKSFPMTPQLLLASRVGSAVQKVLQHTQKQHCQQQQAVDALTHGVAEAANALRRRWKAVLQAAVDAADRSQVQKACEAVQGTSAAKKRKVQQLLTKVATGSKSATFTTPTQQHQYLHLQQLPLARSTSISKQQAPAQAANPTASSDRLPASPTRGSKLLSPAQKLQLLLSRATTGDAAAPAKPTERHRKRYKAQQHVTFSTTEHQADATAPRQSHSLLQQLRAQQQQQQHPTMPVQQVPAGQVKRSRATKSSGQSKQKQQAAAPLAKKQKLDSNTRQLGATAAAGTLLGIQQQPPIASDAVSPRGVHASWLTAFANESILPAGNMQSGKAVPSAAATGAASQTGAAWGPADPNNGSISYRDSAGAGTHTPITQFSLPPLPLAAGRLPSACVSDAPAPSMPLQSSLPGAVACGTTGCCPSSPIDAALHPPPPHVTIRTVRSAAAASGHNPLPGSSAGATAKGQQNAMWGAGAMALRAAKGPGHHGSHHAHHAHHAGQHAGRGGGSHVADHGPPTAQHTWPAAAAATQPIASSYHITIARHGSGAAASSMAPEHQRGIPGGVVSGLNSATGRLGFGPGGTLINGCADRGAAEAAAVHALAGSKPLDVRYGADGFGSGSLGGSGGLGSAGLGSSGGLVASALRGMDGAAGGYMGCVDSDDDEGPVLVDMRLQRGGSALAGMESMPLIGAGLVLSPSL